MNKPENKPGFRWKMLAPENIELQQLYSFTLNLKDSCDTLKDDYDNYLSVISLLIKPYCEFQFCFELSCIGKLHIHGEIIFHSHQDIGRFYHKFGLLKHRFAAELDTIENLGTWRDYCNKQSEIMESGLLPNFGKLCNKDMCENKYLSPKIRTQLEDSFFDSHLDD